MARLHERWLVGEPDGQRADFSGMELDHLDLSGMNFEAACLRGAEIYSCNLSARFMFADFRGAALRGCSASHCSFEGADFTNAECHTSSFSRVRFDSARLRRTQFDGCDFTRCKLECCDMTGVQFRDTELTWVATACSWGETPPARDAETVLAEGKFMAAMLGLSLGDEGKISEWTDEAWSRAQDHTDDDEPVHVLHEPEYQALLTGYADAFARTQAQYPAAVATLFDHGEGFLPEELHGAAAYIAGGGSLEAAQHMEWQGLFLQEPEKIAALATLKEAVDLTITEALLTTASMAFGAATENGEILLDLGELKAAYGIDTLYECSFFDMLRERVEVAGAQLDLKEDTIMLELDPSFASGMTMQMQ